MGNFESFQEESVPEQTPQELKVLKDDSRARKALAALGAAALVTIANQAPVTDLHQQQFKSPELAQPTDIQESPNPWRQDGSVVTLDLKQPITNVDLGDQEKVTNVDLRQEVKNIKLPE